MIGKDDLTAIGVLGLSIEAFVRDSETVFAPSTDILAIAHRSANFGIAASFDMDSRIPVRKKRAIC
jgi:hypothetical protein